MDVFKKKLLNEFVWWQQSVQFVIPVYQRNYVWWKENVEQLLLDIKKMIPTLDDPNKYHFCWSIVMIQSKNLWFFSQYTIIDWQQRLTTIFLILQALKKIFPEQSVVITDTYLMNKHAQQVVWLWITGDSKFRLKPLVSDDNVYVKIANEEELWEEDKKSNVYKAYKIIYDELMNRKNKDFIDFSKILLAIDKLEIVLIQLSNNENPQQVFESINSTWVTLKQSDLIRNFVLMNKDDAFQTMVYEDYWKLIEFKYVKTDNLKEFFRFYISIKKTNTIPDKRVYDEFVKYYTSQLSNWIQEIEILKEILEYSKFYYYITNNSSELWNVKIEQALVRFREIKSNMPILVLMEALKLFNDEKISDDDLIDTINLFTNYIMRRGICNERSNQISSHFWWMLWSIYKNFNWWDLSFYDSSVKYFYEKRMTWAHIPTDENIKEHFLNDNEYSNWYTKLALEKIENNQNNLPIWSLNIEHVMPQTSNDYWKSKINEWSVYDDVVNKIGNLTLVSERDNSKMSNKDFDSKKKVLQKTNHVNLNVRILREDEWNENIINKRSLELVEQFNEIYPFPNMDKFGSVWEDTISLPWTFPLDFDLDVIWLEITGLSYDWQLYPLKYRKQLLPTVAKILYDLDEQKFREIVKDNIIHKSTYNSDKSDRAPILADESNKNELVVATKIDDTDYYVEWVLNARVCKEYTRQLTEQFWITDLFTIDLATS